MEIIYVVTLTVNGVTYELDPGTFSGPDDVVRLTAELEAAARSGEIKTYPLRSKHRVATRESTDEPKVPVYYAATQGGTVIVNAKASPSLHVDGHPSIN